MRYLLRDLDKIKKQLNNKLLFLFLDYDGTVTPIRKKPALGRISKRAKNLLAELAKSSHCKLAIISGRALKDVRKMVGLKNIIYGGNHGLELEGPRIRFKSPVSQRHKAVLKQILRRLVEKLRPVKGVLIENKGLSLSVHYRLVRHQNRALVKRIFREITWGYVERNEVRVKPGKMVLEAYPPVDWDKGKAVQWLLRNASPPKTGVTHIYIGDDVTDEDAFKLLKNSGLGIFVGRPGKSSAQYYVKNTGEVMKFLSWLEEERSLSKTVG
jgi:trehalose 6-phosphate phosphatase